MFCIRDEEQYSKRRKEAYEFSRQFVWENTGKKVEEFIDRIEEQK